MSCLPLLPHGVFCQPDYITAAAQWLHQSPIGQQGFWVISRSAFMATIVAHDSSSCHTWPDPAYPYFVPFLPPTMRMRGWVLGGRIVHNIIQQSVVRKNSRCPSTSRPSGSTTTHTTSTTNTTFKLVTFQARILRKKQRRLQKHSCPEWMIGWIHINFKKVWKFKDSA